MEVGAYIKKLGGVDIKEIPEDFLNAYVQILTYEGPGTALENLEAYKGAMGMAGSIYDKTFGRHANGGIVSLNQLTQPIGYR